MNGFLEKLVSQGKFMLWLASVNCQVVLSANRFIAIYYPVQYETVFERSNTIKYLTLYWSVSAIGPLIGFLGSSLLPTFSPHSNSSVTCESFMPFLPMPINFFVSSATAFKILRSPRLLNRSKQRSTEFRTALHNTLTICQLPVKRTDISVIFWLLPAVSLLRRSADVMLLDLQF